jgi:hypothetical protein
LSPAASPEIADGRPSASALDTDTIVALVLTLAYAALEIALFTLHVPWRDEAQGWLVAQALSQPMDFLIIPSEGHPPLWFWVLRGLSVFTSFDQARYLTLGVALLNAFLFWRLLRHQMLMLVLMLCSSVVILQWGFHFRPYGIVLTLTLLALLLDRSDRRVAGTWALAIACGFHFFAGFLLALWLLVQWRRTPIVGLIAPSVLAALFGISALVSGMDNPAAASSLGNLLPGTLDGLSWWMPGEQFHHPIAGLAYPCLLAFGLWRSPAILAALLSLTLLFAAGTAVIYGEFQWHAAFMMVMAFMAFILAGTKARLWVLMLVLAPQAISGIASAKTALLEHASGDIDIYSIVQADAGLTDIPTQQLVGWPDYMLATAAARLDFTYRSGSNGSTLGPVDWRTRSREMIDPGLGTLPTPYWLVCKECQPVLDFISGAGLSISAIGNALNYSDGRIYAYRIDR